MQVRATNVSGLHRGVVLRGEVLVSQASHKSPSPTGGVVDPERCTCAWYKAPGHPDADCPEHGSYAKARDEGRPPTHHRDCVPREDYDALMAVLNRALAANAALAKELRELKDKSE